MDLPQQFKLHKSLEREFGRMAVKNARSLEKLERKSARFANHLHYTLHCKHHGVVPPSLRIKTSVKGPNASRIIRNTQSLLLNERIRQINATISITKRNISDVDEQLFSILPVDVYTEVKNWCTHARQATWTTCETRQRKKFALLVDRLKSRKSTSPVSLVNEEDIKRTKERWVVNKSDRTLSESELSVLQKGLNYSVVPNSVPITDFITGIETACHALGASSDTSTQLRSDCVRILKDCKPPKAMLPRRKGRRYVFLRRIVQFLFFLRTKVELLLFSIEPPI
jgi:hypothetical protein